MTETEPKIRFPSSRFGDIEIPESRLINVPEGIIGFPDFKRYALLDPSRGESLFLWLHSIDEPNLAFIIADPLAINPDYKIDITEPDLERLSIAQKSPPALFVIVTVPQNNPDNISANLLAPLLYFESGNLLYQVVLEKGGWPLKFYLLDSSEPDSCERAADPEPPGEVL